MSEFVTFTDDDGVTYEPWTDSSSVGLKATDQDGRVEFIYLCPSSGSSDGIATVFLYQDRDTPGYGNSLTHVTVCDPRDDDAPSAEDVPA